MSREVPEGWASTTLGELAQISGGTTPSKEVGEFWERGRHFWATPTDITALPPGKVKLSSTKTMVSDAALQKTSLKMLPVGSVLMTSRATIGYPAINDVPVATNQGFANFHPSAKYDAAFLAYWIVFSRKILERSAGGSTFLEISKSALRSIHISLPPLHEQRRIAEILSSVDEAIAATRAVIERTRTVKQGVLERLLTKGIGHTRFKQMEIGKIPDGWETGKIGDFFTLQRGFDITEKQSTAGEYPVVSSSGISYFHSEAMVHGPAVITGRKGKLGQVHFIDSSCWPHDTTLWVKDFKGNAPKFVYWFLRSLNLEKFDAATAVPTLNRNVVHALRCAFPPVSEQLLISDHLDSIEATEDAQTCNLTAYGQMKSALMSDLLTGRKRVTDALPMAAE